MTVREVLKLLHNEGWFVYEQNGSHIQLKHPAKKGRVTVHSILKQAGLE